MADAASKGRLSVPRPGRQKVTPAQLAELLTLRASGAKLIDLAARYGVSKTFVSLVARGKRRQYDAEPAA